MKVIGIVGWKNSGKTSLVERLVSEIAGRGYSISTVKHAHHRFQVDRPGTDSFRHRSAGAREVMLASSMRWALMHEDTEQATSNLQKLLEKLEPVDLVIVEGFKKERHVKIETRRSEAAGPRLANGDETILAVATDSPDQSEKIPAYDLDDTVGIADFILGLFDL